MHTTRQFNAIKLAKFLRVIKRHNLWKKTNGKAGKQANFANTSFELVDASMIDFEFTSLDNCLFFKNALVGMKFSGNNFDRCHFHDCDMSGSIFSDCSLKYTNFFNCNFSSVTFSFCDLSNAMVNSSNLDRSEFFNTSLNSASLPDSSLRETRFVSCVFLWSNFSRCDLRGAKTEPSIKKAMFLRASKWLRSDVPWWLGHSDQDTIILCDQ